MVLIPSGKFNFGTDFGDDDEYPAQILFLNDFYIDKYEVSNRDYLIYIKDVHGDPPLSWKNKDFDEKSADFPVLVSYYEAQDYAKWAGKRLPTEQEWEKAARAGRDTTDKSQGASIYPWGTTFKPELVNSLEFWSKEDIGKEIKRKYSIFVNSLLPIDSFPGGASFFGVQNMAGNAAEWTTSWYMPYENNRRINGRYGTQYRVIRGGACYTPWYNTRVTNREIGGIPNQFTDTISGFRCVKDVSIRDEVRE